MLQKCIISTENLKADVLQNILKSLVFLFLNISSSIYKVYIEIKKPTYFHCFALKTDISLFCHRDIPTIHNDYCVSNAVDYAEKNDALPTICQLN